MKREYAFLMIDFKTPSYIKKLQDSIPKKELYLGEEEDTDNQYGIETESHVTLAPCLDLDVDLEKLKTLLLPLSDYKCILSNISVFENEKYDVLKSDVKCPNMHKTYNKIKDNFEIHSEYKEYHPHMTIAYLKPSLGEKYKKKLLDKIEELEPINFNFSNGENNKFK